MYKKNCFLVHDLRILKSYIVLRVFTQLRIIFDINYLLQSYRKNLLLYTMISISDRDFFFFDTIYKFLLIMRFKIIKTYKV